MNQDLPPPTPWEALEALAAGELPAAEAKALRARIEGQAALRAPWQQVRDLEARLRGEPLLPAPLALLSQTIARVLPPAPVRPWHALARAAAAVLVFCGSWFVFSDAAPALASGAPSEGLARLSLEHLGPRPEIIGSLPAVRPPAALTQDARTRNTAGAALWGLGGLGMIAAGAWIARGPRRGTA